MIRDPIHSRWLGRLQRGALFACVPLLVGTGASARAENLLRNPSFEKQAATGFNHASFWMMNHPTSHGGMYGSASREDWRSYDGLYIMTVRGQWAEAGDYGGCWQEAVAEAGIEYRASGWFWSDPEWEAESQEMKLEFWAANHARLLGSSSISLADVSSAWEKREIQAEAPDGTAYVRLVIHAEGVGYYGALQWDHMVLAAADEYEEPIAIPVDLIIDILD